MYSERKGCKTFAIPSEEDKKTTGERSMESRVALNFICAYTNDSGERNIFQHRINDQFLAIFGVIGTMQNIQKLKFFEVLSLHETHPED